MPPTPPKPLPTTPTAAAYAQADLFRNAGLGNLWTEFEALHPSEGYSFSNRQPPPPGSWKIVKPEKAPPIGDLPQLIKNLIKSTWKFTEPTWDNTKGTLPGHYDHGITIGQRGVAVDKVKVSLPKYLEGRGVIGRREFRPQPGGSLQYSPQVRPTSPVITTEFPNDTAIASDWHLFKWVERTNAVTFRGDSRSPFEVITKAGGFHPPNSRTDRYYLENNVYEAFKNYLKRRYNRDLDKNEFLNAIDNTAVTLRQKNLIVDFTMWAMIAEKEAAHLGRMVENECLKGYISTARRIDTSLGFATRQGDNYYVRPGWLYLTVVHAAFLVPDAGAFWGSEEAEIAQWGSIPSARIVGFAYVQQSGIPAGPIFIRRSFQIQEPQAFEHMRKVMSGWIPS